MFWRYKFRISWRSLAVPTQEFADFPLARMCILEEITFLGGDILGTDGVMEPFGFFLERLPHQTRPRKQKPELPEEEEEEEEEEGEEEEEEDKKEEHHPPSWGTLKKQHSWMMFYGDDAKEPTPKKVTRKKKKDVREDSSEESEDEKTEEESKRTMWHSVLIAIMSIGIAADL
jgi:hypothetical protein